MQANAVVEPPTAVLAVQLWPGQPSLVTCCIPTLLPWAPSPLRSVVPILLHYPLQLSPAVTPRLGPTGWLGRARAILRLAQLSGTKPGGMAVCLTLWPFLPCTSSCPMVHASSFPRALPHSRLLRQTEPAVAEAYPASLASAMNNTAMHANPTRALDTRTRPVLSFRGGLHVGLPPARHRTLSEHVTLFLQRSVITHTAPRASLSLFFGHRSICVLVPPDAAFAHSPYASS